ncbi:MAG: hypothetical protein L6R38_002468 [Xanthoria sp. 2 TBL-2021]|nr:MAG: hypothetical protein L6R38_002468 [Xanthoria sp. 2 TBL-2021]
MATKLQLSVYLLGVCLFSISFLVFVNATVSFVITDIIHQRRNIGDAAGTLGFADELLGLVACPFWGLLSDRIGFRLVAVIGYAIIAASLFILVQATNVYPQLLLARLLFSLGASCASTMVTAILPSMVSKTTSTAGQQPSIDPSNQGPVRAPHDSRHAHLAGFVGLFTGIGALLALGAFLPIPDRLQRVGVTPEKALADTYYVVAATAIVVAVACYFGFGGASITSSDRSHGPARVRSVTQRASNTLSYIPTVLKLGVTQPSLGLGFLASFVARSSSVGISLFIPLFVNASLCDKPAHGVEDVKAHCRKAYVIAAQLSGVSQVFALAFAPVFGYFPLRHRHFNIPLTAATLSGAVGYVFFARMNTSEISPPSLAVMALLGISQIGAIVHSLSLVSSFVTERRPTKQAETNDAVADEYDHEETTRLLNDNNKPLAVETHEHLKGTIAGVYSFAGSLAILILTKLGGVLFDRLGPEAPFYLLSIFNVGLLLAVVACGALEIYRSRGRK